MMPHPYLLHQEQQRREEVERQLYYTAASMEDMRRQLIDLQNVYQQQSVMLEHERQQRESLVEQVRQQQTMLVEKERQQIRDKKQRRLRDITEKQQQLRDITKKQQQLIQRVSDEVRRFHAAKSQENSTTSCESSDEPADDDADHFPSSAESLLSISLSTVPSEIPAPAKYPQVDWSLDYSMARLEDMLEVPESARNTLFYALLNFHCKRLEKLNVDYSEGCDDLIKRVNDELCNKKEE